MVTWGGSFAAPPGAATGSPGLESQAREKKAGAGQRLGGGDLSPGPGSHCALPDPCSS